MDEELIPLNFSKILQSRTYTVIVLGTEEKKFAIYTEPQVGKNIQLHMTQEHKIRPFTHDLLSAILNGLDIKPLQIVINDIEDSIFFARLFLEQKTEGKRRLLEIDARPSDCVTLALIHNIPVFCRKEILDQAIPYQE